jgi:hypothetical protein
MQLRRRDRIRLKVWTFLYWLARAERPDSAARERCGLL